MEKVKRSATHVTESQRQRIYERRLTDLGPERRRAQARGDLIETFGIVKGLSEIPSGTHFAEDLNPRTTGSGRNLTEDCFL